MGCGNGAGPSRKDAAQPNDVPSSSGGVLGAGGLGGSSVATGLGGTGLVPSGGVAASGITSTATAGGGSAGLGGYPSTGGMVSTGGNSAAGGSEDASLGGVLGSGGSGAGGMAIDGSSNDGGSADGASGCVDVCTLYGDACCVWSDPCLVPTGSCTFEVLAASVDTTYQYADLESKVAALPQDLSVSFTDHDIAWAAADPWPAGRIELHLTDDAASRYGTILDGARDGRVFRVSCGGQSLFVGVFYIWYGEAALDTPVLHEARENGVVMVRLGAYEGAWMGLDLTPATSPLRERIDRSELRAALCRRGILHVLDPHARPASP